MFTVVDLAESNKENKSIQTLGRIFRLISSCKTRGKVVLPFRESKLTKLLQTNITQSSKILLMATV